MSITEPEADIPVEGDDAQDGDQTPLPNRRELWWPIVQALREIGRPASDEEITERVADSLSLTHQQRTVMIPSGQETRLKNRVGWAGLELKHIGVIHRPKPGLRELTTLGQEVDEARTQALLAEYEANKRRNQPGSEQPEGQERADTPAAWLIRAGGSGESAELFIENGIAAIGFDMPRDLSDVSSRDEMVELVSTRSPESSDQQVRPRAGQLWTMRSEVRRGHLVVMPCKGSSQFALGIVTRGYWYRHDSDRMPHTVSVDWKRTDVPRLAVEQDLLRTLSYRRTIRSIGSKDEAWRLHQLLKAGRDPGAPVGTVNGSCELGIDLPGLVEEFYRETGYPTDTHGEQERLREEWAEKLAPENVASLTREDLAAYVSLSTPMHSTCPAQPRTSLETWMNSPTGSRNGQKRGPSHGPRQSVRSPPVRGAT